MSVSSNGEIADSELVWYLSVGIGSSTSSSIFVLRVLPAAPVCSGLELFFTSKPLRVLGDGCWLWRGSSFHALRAQASNPTRRAFLTCGPACKAVHRTAVSKNWLRYHECCQDDSVNCSCFRKDKMKLKALFDPCAVCAYTGQTVHCTTELYLCGPAE